VSTCVDVDTAPGSGERLAREFQQDAAEGGG